MEILPQHDLNWMGRWVLNCNISAKIENPLFNSQLTRNQLRPKNNNKSNSQIVFGSWRDILAILKFFDIYLPYDLSEDQAQKIHNPLFHQKCVNHNITWCKTCVEKSYRENKAGYEIVLSEIGHQSQKWTSDRNIKPNNGLGISTYYYLDMRKLGYNNWNCGLFTNWTQEMFDKIKNYNGFPYKTYEMEVDVRYIDNRNWDENCPI